MKRIVVGSLLAAVLYATAHAETVRFPETGYPAFVVRTPDGWTHRADDSGNMLLLSGNHSSSFSLSMVAFDGSAAELAEKALQTTDAEPPRHAGKEALAGFDGDAFDTTMVSTNGTHVNIHMIAAKPDPRHVAAIARITRDDISADDFAAAQSVVDNTDIESGR